MWFMVSFFSLIRGNIKHVYSDYNNLGGTS